MYRLYRLALLIILGLIAASSYAQTLTPYSYDLGSPDVVDYYIDPTSGSDTSNGLSVSTAWRTVQHAWNQIPSTTLARGYRINLMNGSYGNDELPNYWELRHGTSNAPIILQAASGQSNVRFVRDINMANVSYFYLIGVNITPSPAGDTFHCESCDHILVRGCTLNGGSTTDGAHETLKINQSQYIYIENNNISNADDNNIDFVAVQYAHIIGNRVHDALDWCMYVKGGSAYIRVEGNEFSECGTGGITAGQGSGFQFMVSPWIHYEAYDVKIINNIVHDVVGAAFGVNGGYNVLIAHNTAYKVGSRDHLIEVVFGERTCDGEAEGAADTTCALNHSLGGWGADTVRTTPDPIGNRNVKIINNIIYNPPSVVAAQHFAIYGPRTPAGGANLASPQFADTNLEISGNIIWNGVGSALLGIEDTEQGCQSSNMSCNESQLLTDNKINTLEPDLNAPNDSDFRPIAGSDILLQTPAALTSFAGGDRESTPQAAEGELSNAFIRDFSGAESSGARVIGAFDSISSSLVPPTIGDSTTPQDPNGDFVPSLSRLVASAKYKGRSAKISVSAKVASITTVSRVTATISKGAKRLKTIRLSKSGSLYKKSTTVNAKRRTRLTVLFSATNGAGSAVFTKNVRVQ